MCTQPEQDATSAETKKKHRDNDQPRQDFPWHLGAFDAHCHPTDTMPSIQTISSMKARTLTIMATRSQDQHLVSQVADKFPIDSLDQHPTGKAVVPSFGWHPWFSHQLYDDSAATSSSGSDSVSSLLAKANHPDTPPEDKDALIMRAKRAHYNAVLAPPPSEKDEQDILIPSLPVPTPVSSFISSARPRLLSHPLALVGEIGLDKAFRVPNPRTSNSCGSNKDDDNDDSYSSLTPGGREGRTLSPCRVRIPHQQTILEAQLRLAGDLGRPVSVHSVHTHGLLLQTLSSCWKGHELEVMSRRQRRDIAPGAEDDYSDTDSDSDSYLPPRKTKANKPEAAGNTTGGKPFPPRICLHSFSAGVEFLSQWLDRSIPARMYFSFSTAVNMGTDSTAERTRQVLAGVPDDRILVESDLHTAGEDMDDALENMYRLVCEIKGWTLEEGVTRIGKNYRSFIFG